MNQHPQDKIGAGRIHKANQEMHFKRGSLIFIEGELSREMYIVKTGKIRVICQEGEGVRELGILGPGSVIGELSLLDSQPRTATAQVVEDAVASVIDEELFRATIEKVPSWLANVIQLIVKRLRTTMEKASDDVVKGSICGVVRVLLLLAQTTDAKMDEKNAVPLLKLKEAVHETVGLGGGGIEEILFRLILKEMVVIRKDSQQVEHILINNRQVLELYMNYHRAVLSKTKIIGSNFTEQTFALMETILCVSKRLNSQLKADSIVKITTAQVELELQRQGQRYIDPEALEQLARSKVIIVENCKVGTAHGNHSKTMLIFKPQLLEKLTLLQGWLPVFRADICY